MMQLKALLGEILIGWGFMLANDAWNDATLIAYAHFHETLLGDLNAHPPRRSTP